MRRGGRRSAGGDESFSYFNSSHLNLCPKMIRGPREGSQKREANEQFKAMREELVYDAPTMTIFHHEARGRFFNAKKKGKMKFMNHQASGVALLRQSSTTQKIFLMFRWRGRVEATFGFPCRCVRRAKYFHYYHGNPLKSCQMRLGMRMKMRSGADSCELL